VFDPGLGSLRAGFLVSRYGFDSCGDFFEKSRKNKQREKTPAPGWADL
jgi:hypothetical protein